MTEYKSIKEIENKLKDVINLNYDDVLKDYKTKYLRAKIAELNIYNIKRHALSDEVNYNHHEDISFLKLRYDEEFNFKDIDKKIKSVFDALTVKDKIKEVMPYLMIEKHFNKENKKYYSFYDLKKEYTKGEINNIIDSLNKFCFDCGRLEDVYYRRDALKGLIEFLFYQFNIDLRSVFNDINKLNCYQDDLKTIEKVLNENNKQVTINLFNKWFYLSFKDDKNTRLLRTLLKEQMLKRLDFE